MDALKFEQNDFVGSLPEARAGHKIVVLRPDGGPVPAQVDAVDPDYPLPPLPQVQKGVGKVPCAAPSAAAADFKDPSAAARRT